MKLGKVSQANWGREEERAGQNSCGQQGAGSACRKGRAGCQREKLRPRGNTRSTRRVRSERASSLWVLGSPSGSEAPRGLHTRSCQGAAAQGTSADLLAYLWAVKTASADSPVPFPLSRHSVENSSASVPPFSITPQCNHVKNVKKVYFYCYYESQRRRKKKKFTVVAKVAAAKHRLGFGRTDAEGQCLGHGVLSERMRSGKDGR